MSARRKFGLAIVTVAFLLLNPMLGCALMAAPSPPPAHPCCQKPQATSGCVCVCTPPAPAAVSLNANQELVPALQVTSKAGVISVAAAEGPALVERAFRADDRYLTFHPLLL